MPTLTSNKENTNVGVILIYGLQWDGKQNNQTYSISFETIFLNFSLGNGPVSK